GLISTPDCPANRGGRRAPGPCGVPPLECGGPAALRLAAPEPLRQLTSSPFGPLPWPRPCAGTPAGLFGKELTAAADAAGLITGDSFFPLRRWLWCARPDDPVLR